MTDDSNTPADGERQGGKPLGDAEARKKGPWAERADEGLVPAELRGSEGADPAAPDPTEGGPGPALPSGERVLIPAPTGSGKTLAAFLYAIDQLAAAPRPENPRDRRIGLVYVSPLKALSYDIDRTRRTPRRGIGAELPVAVRTGDTPQRERQQMLRNAPDILITTPESLYLMLTGRPRELFDGAPWCIIDEIHAVA